MSAKGRCEYCGGLRVITDETTKCEGCGAPVEFIKPLKKADELREMMRPMSEQQYSGWMQQQMLGMVNAGWQQSGLAHASVAASSWPFCPRGGGK